MVQQLPSERISQAVEPRASSLGAAMPGFEPAERARPDLLSVGIALTALRRSDLSCFGTLPLLARGLVRIQLPA